MIVAKIQSVTKELCVRGAINSSQRVEGGRFDIVVCGKFVATCEISEIVTKSAALARTLEIKCVNENFQIDLQVKAAMQAGCSEIKFRRNENRQGTIEIEDFLLAKLDRISSQTVAACEFMLTKVDSNLDYEIVIDGFQAGSVHVYEPRRTGSDRALYLSGTDEVIEAIARSVTQGKSCELFAR